MADNFVIEPGDVVDVIIDEAEPIVTVEVTSPASLGVVTLLGPQGIPGTPGPAGPSYEGVAWWYGEGAPAGIVGSKPGDYYLDTSSGQIFVLGGE